MGLSVVVLTRNSARHLRECLESVRWAEEILVLDDASQDATLAIAREYGACIHAQPRAAVEAHLGNFDVARNLGFALATQEWILALDSDEVVPPALRDEIAAVVASDERAAFLVPRLNLFWGRPARLLGADHQLRLFRKGEARYEGCHLDQRAVVRGPTACLESGLIHRQADSLGELLAKLRERTTQRARALDAESAPAERPAPLFYHTFRYYCREHGAARDGWRGILLAAVYALYPALAHAKLRRLRRGGAGREV